MATNILEIDKIDRNIIQIIQEEPNLTHTQIAKRIQRSQPTVGMRIRKLKKAGVLKFQAGINLKNVDLHIANIYLNTNNPQAIKSLVKTCPFMLNGFKHSGDFNYTILLVGFKLDHLDNIVNNHFRNHPEVNHVEMNIVTDIINDFVLPFKLDQLEYCENGCENHCCGKCLT